MKVFLFVLVISVCAGGQISMVGGTGATNGTLTGPPIQEVVFGDSVSAGAGANSPAFFNSSAGLVMQHYGWEQRNYAVGGTGIGDTQQFQHQFPARSVAGQNTLTLLGINDVFFNPSGTLDLTNWGNAAMANILYGSVVYSDNIRARDGAWTLVGTWTNGSSGVAVYDNDGTKQTSTVGDTATISVSGTTVYLVYLAFTSGDVSFNVSIDSVSQGSFSNTGLAQSFTLTNYLYYPVAFRFSGLTSISHSLKVTYSSGTTPLILMWVTGNANANKPKYFVGNCIPEQTNTNATDVANLNAKLLTITNALKGDGLKVYYVDANSVVDPVNDMCSQVHPCQSSYNKIAIKFESLIDANP